MKKLSESLRELTEHVAEMEKKVAAAEKQNEEKVEAAIDASKANAKARQDEFKANISEGQAAMASQWEDLQTNYNRQVAQFKSSIEAKKEAHELNRAMNRADDAEIATLEAIEARAYADLLHKTNMSA